MRRLAVFAGSCAGNDPRYIRDAERLGAEIARAGLELVYGGASIGLMGSVATAALAGGSRVTGVVPTGLWAPEHDLTIGIKAIRVSTMAERKELMMRSADAFVVMPGGYGTLDELFEVLSMMQLGQHTKPVGLLDTGGYYRPLKDLLAQMHDEGFLWRDGAEDVTFDDQPRRLIASLLDLHQAARTPPRGPGVDVGSGPRRGNDVGGH